MTDILSRTHAAIEHALDDGAELKHWQLTLDGWRNLDPGTDHWALTARDWIGSTGYRPLYELPVQVVAGSGHACTLVCKGARYDEHGLITYPRRVGEGREH